jgi:hypothetical protein
MNNNLHVVGGRPQPPQQKITAFKTATTDTEAGNLVRGGWMLLETYPNMNRTVDEGPIVFVFIQAEEA